MLSLKDIFKTASLIFLGFHGNIVILRVFLLLLDVYFLLVNDRRGMNIDMGVSFTGQWKIGLKMF